MRFVRSLVFAFGALITAPALAQSLDGFALDRFHPAPAGDRFFGVQGSDPGGSGQINAMLLGNYARRPLVLYVSDGGDDVGSVVSDQLFLHGALSLSIAERLLLSVDVPIALVTEGDSPETGGLAFSSPSGAALGDVRLGARVRLVGQPRTAAQLSLGGYLWIPTGDDDKLVGDGSVRGMPALILSGESQRFAYAINAGVVFRAERAVDEAELGSELHFGAAAGLLFANRKVQVGPELYGSTTFADAFDEATTPLEALLGVRGRVGSFVLGAGAGPGFTEAIGTPTFRIVASITYAPEPTKAAPKPQDRDGDGIYDASDACPELKGVASDDPSKNGCPPDRDGDGILDSEDACPDVKGVASEDPEKNGCPPDRDGDGILDSDDACPDVKGVASDDPEKNGCPPDKDGDGILDADDACPDVKGVASDDPQQNGCPPDTDGDTIRDDRDACPKEKGPADPDPEKNGCPALVRVTEQEIVILQQVQFKTASDQILPASDELLTQVAAVLQQHPEITKIEVQGHTDDRGSDVYNKNLSQRRAASVLKWLTTKGKLDASRLTAQGYGEEQPIAGNDSEEGRQKNRRVQFKIVETSRDTSSEKGGEQ